MAGGASLKWKTGPQLKAPGSSHHVIEAEKSYLHVHQSKKSSYLLWVRLTAKLTNHQNGAFFKTKYVTMATDTAPLMCVGTVTAIWIS